MKNALGRLLAMWQKGDLEYAICLFEQTSKDTDRGNQLNFLMRELGLNKLGIKEDSLFEQFPPAFHVGTAFRFASYYGIEFHAGTHHGECRAVLSRDKWKRPINPDVSLEALAYFVIPKSHDEIQEFQAISRKVEHAVCECLIRARTAGVI